MTVLRIYAEIQVNPDSVAAYRQLVDYYKGSEYAAAFEYLIRMKFGNGHHNTDNNQEQSENN
jgi:hypothetical protein